MSGGADGVGAVSALDAARAALAAREGGRPVAVVLRAGGGEPGRMLVYSADERRGTLGDAALDAAGVELGLAVLAGDAVSGGGSARTVQGGGDPGVGPGGAVELVAESHRRPATLLIVGAGHIAVPLARLGVLLGLRVEVLDDREEFATDARFPDAAEVRRVSFPDAFAEVAVAASDFVVLVTRAHRYDFDCLRALVTAPVVPRYIGMVGSRRRVRAAFGALLAAGIERDRLEAVHAPIGLDIGAETPEEIAVSIAAELVAARRGGSGGSLRDRERVVGRLV